MPRDPTTLFEDAIDLPLWLEADRATPYAERVRRDREVAKALPPKAALLTRARLWWRAVAPGDAPAPGARLDRLRALVTLAMAAIGVLTGVTVALAAFAYDGSEPVNVVRLLALLVGLQLVLLAFTLLLLPGRITGFRGLQDLPVALNPGAWAYGAFRKLARAQQGVAALFDRPNSRTAAGRFARWQLLYWSQTAAVAFNVAAIVTAVALVTFSDLAFGWSTTLEADPALVGRVVRAAAWPWHAWLPAAVPSAELIEQSQFFRLERGARVTATAPGALGAWWPFTIAALVTYGLLPRLALLVLAAARLRAATVALLLDDPRVTALLDRMGAPAIESAAGAHEAPPVDGAAAAEPLPPVTGSAAAVIWEGSTSAERARDYARRHLGVEIHTLVEAGVGAPAADRSALERLAAEASSTVLVLTPAWEPPLLELVDTLAELRTLVGKAVSIVVVPVPEGERAVTQVERATWQRAIGRLADPKLYVEAGAA
jgi:hypothetical protein